MQEGPHYNEPAASTENLVRPFETPQEVIRVDTVELDPILSGFTGIVSELSRNGDLFTLYQFASATGNRLLFVQSRNESRIRELFQKEADAMLQLAMLYDNPPAKSR